MCRAKLPVWRSEVPETIDKAERCECDFSRVGAPREAKPGDLQGSVVPHVGDEVHVIG